MRRSLAHLAGAIRFSRRAGSGASALAPDTPDRAPPLARWASAQYALAGISISIWALVTPLKADPGLLGHLALFVPLVVYALALALAARRVRSNEAGCAAPAVIVYGLLVVHSAIGFVGSTILAVLGAMGNPRGGGIPEWAAALAGLTWLAMLFGWIAVVPVVLGTSGSRLLFLLSLLGSAWLLMWGMQLGLDIL